MTWQNKDDTVAKETEHPLVAPYPPGVMVKRHKTVTVQGNIQIQVSAVIVPLLHLCNDSKYAQSFDQNALRDFPKEQCHHFTHF